MPHLARITQDPRVLGGNPRIRGLRVSVGTIVGLHPKIIKQLMLIVERK
jgi:uncharacterized protein (DUF433 family)